MTEHRRSVFGITFPALLVFMSLSASSEAEAPFSVPAGRYESKAPADTLPQYFRVQPASAHVELEFTGPDYLVLPSNGIWEATQYVFIKPLVVNSMGMEVDLGQGPETITLSKKNDKFVVSAQGRSPYVNRQYVLESLTGEHGAIIMAHDKADEALRKGSLEGYLDFHGKDFRSSVCVDKDALKTAIESAMKNLPGDRIEGRTYPAILINASRALVETRQMWMNAKYRHGDWNMECLVRKKDGWKIASTEIIPSGFQSWVGEKGYMRKGEPLFYPRLPGWEMYSIVSIRPNGSQTYAVAEFSPDLDAVLSFVVQMLPEEKPEGFDLKAFAEGDLPRLKEQYPEFKAEKQEAVKIGERDFYSVDCRYRFWFGESRALRYYHLTAKYAYIIVYNSYDEKTWETRRGEAEKAILDAKLP